MHDCHNWDWNLKQNSAGNYSWEQVHTAVLMDIRDALQRMNEKLSVLQCGNFLRIPRVLESIKQNTKRKKPRIAARNQPTKGRKRS